MATKCRHCGSTSYGIIQVTVAALVAFAGTNAMAELKDGMSGVH